MQVLAIDTHPVRRLGVRLAECDADIRAAQRLRATVFGEEMGASLTTADGLDADRFDSLCDHLLVEDLAGDAPEVVGTYRLLRQSVAQAHGGFYSATEFDLEPVVAPASGECLELGRSCVAPAYRDSATIQLLWRGLADYLHCHRISAMFGCASFPGVDPDAHAEGLSYLAHNHLSPRQFCVAPLAGRQVEMARLPLGAYDQRLALRKLPPLIKGYLRVGATVGNGAVIDADFNTIDVFVMLPVEAISARYLDRLGKAA
jgi:L-ornithine Nalpha-acyltransferase